MTKKNHDGYALLILLIIGVLVAAGLYLFSLSKTNETNKKIAPASSNSSDTPAQKAQGAVEATKGVQDSLNKAGSLIEHQ